MIDDGAALDETTPVEPETAADEAPVEETPVPETPIDDTVTDDSPAIADEAPAEAPAAPVVDDPVAVVASLAVTTVRSTDKNAAGWAFGESRAFGHHEYVADGLHVWTEDDHAGLSTSKSAGYVAASFPLADAATTSIDFRSYSGVRPSVQLAVDRDGNGTWDGYLVYEPWAYGDGNWWTSKTGFGVPSNMGYASFGTIEAFVAANPAAKVIGVGYSLGSGVLGDAVIKKIVVGGATYTFGLAPVVVTPPVVTTVHSTDKNAAGWAFGESRAFGHHEYVADGLHVWTEDDHAGLSTSKSAGYVAASFPLADAATTSIDFALILRCPAERSARGRPGRQRHLGRLPRLRALGLRRRQLVDLEDRLRRPVQHGVRVVRHHRGVRRSEPRCQGHRRRLLARLRRASATPSSTRSSSAERPTPSGSHPSS